MICFYNSNNDNNNNNNDNDKNNNDNDKNNNNNYNYNNNNNLFSIRYSNTLSYTIHKVLLYNISIKKNCQLFFLIYNKIL
jgi:hypothetical protein